jgi:integrase
LIDRYGPIALAALRARHKPKATGFVFTTATGGHPRRSNLRQRELNPICVAAKVDGLTIHGLRHSATSLALTAETPAEEAEGRFCW